MEGRLSPADDARAPVLFLGLPMAISVRDVLRTGVLARLLDAGLEVHLFAPGAALDALAGEFGHPRLRLHALRAPSSRAFARMDGALLRLHTLVLSLRTRTAAIMTTVSRRRPAVRLVRGLLGRSRRAQDAVLAMTRWAWRRLGPELYEDAFADHAPDLVVGTRVLTMTGPKSTGADRYLDRHLLLSAARRGVPTMVLVASWDNLTTSGFFPVELERLTVWNELMRAQAVEVHGIPPERVEVTGAPQHDVYAPGAFRDRREFLEALELDPARPVVVYATGTEGSIPDEPGIVRQVVDRLVEEIPGVQVLVRLHQLDRRDRYGDLEGRPGVVVEEAGRAGPLGFADRDFDRAQLERLADTLRHADVVLNFASSISVDSAAVGTPVVVVDFDAAEGVPYHRSGRRFYDFDHQRPVVTSGGVARAGSPAEVAAAVRAYLADPTRDEQGRCALVARVCHRIDGRSAERVAGAVLGQLRRGRTGA